jgi:hypothetical protein
MRAEKEVIEEPVLASPAPDDGRRNAKGKAGASCDPREARILAYHDASLRTEDLLAANVAAVNADVMLVGYQLKRLLAPALEMAASDPGALARLLPAVDRYLRTARTVDRFSSFLDRLSRQAQVVAQAQEAAAASERTGLRATP